VKPLDKWRLNKEEPEEEFKKRVKELIGETMINVFEKYLEVYDDIKDE